MTNSPKAGFSWISRDYLTKLETKEKQGPGPGHYETPPPMSLSASFSRAPRRKKSSRTPGPGDYSLPTPDATLKRTTGNIRLAKGPRIPENRHQTPGPGNYSTPIPLKVPGPKFATSEKRVNINKIHTEVIYDVPSSFPNMPRYTIK